MNKIGKDFSDIPRELINYKPEEDRIQCIRNKNGKELIHYPKENSYKIFSDNVHEYLTDSDLKSEWQEFNPFEDLIVKHNINVL